MTEEDISVQVERFFDRPRFWFHLKSCILYPWLLFRYHRRMKALAARSVRWRELATATVVPTLENQQNIKRTVEAVVEELEQGKQIPEPSSKKTY